jgi:hypothetical protein
MHLEPIIGIFPEDLLKLVVGRSDHMFQNETLRPSVTFWDNSQVEFSRPVLTHSIPKPDEIYQMICEEVQRIDEKLKVREISFYYWTPGSYMPWQGYDGLTSNKLTVFLNPEWNIKDGGLLLYANEQRVGAIIPHSNLGVFRVGHIKHSTTTLGLKAPILKTLEIEFENLI